MRSRVDPDSRLPQVHRRLRRVVLLLLLGTTSSRAQDVHLPPSLLLPNYDRVYPGLVEALEAGAFTARARLASAVAYNPAGISRTERTVLNASVQGYQLTALGGTGFEHASPVSSFEAIPSFVGLVLGSDVIDWEKVRLGFAVVTPVHWDQSAVANSSPQPGQRASYDVHSSFSTVVPTMSVGWEISSTFRLGASIEFPYTSLSNQGQLSGELTTATTSQGLLRTVGFGGSTLDVVGVGGVQWTPVHRLRLGLLVRSPGLKVLSTGSIHYEALSTLTTGSQQVYFDDRDARFEYRSPMEVSMAAAVALGPVEVELDVRWHNGTHTYSMFSSSVEARIVDTSSEAPVVTSFAFPGIQYRARQVWNGSVGGHLALSPTVSLHAGAYLDESPVDLLGQGFRRVDMIGVRGGVGLQLGKVAASVGIGWEHGKATDDLSPDGPIPSAHSELSLNTFTVLFSAAFRF
jgi:hypothetical protein